MKLAYIDSCVWIAEIEGLPEYQCAIDRQLQTLTEQGWTLCTSDVVLLEVLIKPLLGQQTALVQRYHQLLKTLKHLRTYPRVFTQALHVAQTEHLKAMDAVHVALAKHFRCQLFVSSDPGFRALHTMPPCWIDLSVCISSFVSPTPYPDDPTKQHER